MSAAHLLLVDDSPDVTLLVRALARRGGYRLSAAADVEQGWRLLHADRPDLVLLDVNLTGASGLELLRRLRGVGQRPAVALFVQPELTDDLAAGWALGADFVVSKALLGEPARWQARVAAVLARAGGQTPRPGVQCELSTAAPPDHFPSPTWPAALSRALRGAAFRPLGPALLAEVLRRAWPDHPFCSSPPTDADLGRACAALVEQLWRLYGPEVSEAGRQALRAEMPSE